jgi:hypothetical protein
MEQRMNARSHYIGVSVEVIALVKSLRRVPIFQIACADIVQKPGDPRCGDVGVAVQVKVVLIVLPKEAPAVFVRIRLGP